MQFLKKLKSGFFYYSESQRSLTQFRTDLMISIVPYGYRPLGNLICDWTDGNKITHYRNTIIERGI